MSDPKEPAFPRSYVADGHNGMTLRDYFAGQVISGLMANSGGPIQANQSNGWSYCNVEPQDVARIAYMQADAMMAERDK